VTVHPAERWMPRRGPDSHPVEAAEAHGAGDGAEAVEEALVAL
jgi:hypothetical protein